MWHIAGLTREHLKKIKIYKRNHEVLCDPHFLRPLLNEVTEKGLNWTKLTKIKTYLITKTKLELIWLDKNWDKNVF